MAEWIDTWSFSAVGSGFESWRTISESVLSSFLTATRWFLQSNPSLKATDVEMLKISNIIVGVDQTDYMFFYHC